MLADGGNAVDACIAAAFVSWVTESPLTGPGAGGFMLIHHAADDSTRVLDHFVAVPGLGLRRRGQTEMDSVDVDFTPESSQAFRIGAASCAVPGAVAGLGEAHRQFASLPWPDLLEPAIELARDGVEMTEPQAYLHAILDLILRHTDEGRAIYGHDGNRLVAGDRLVMADLAETLERLAEKGADDFYRGELARAVVQHVREHGGDFTAPRLRRLSRDQAQADSHELPGPRLRVESAALDRGRSDRSRRQAARPARRPRGPRRERRGDGAGRRDDARAGSGPWRPFARELYRGGLARRLFDDRGSAGDGAAATPAPAGGAAGDNAYLGRGRAGERGLAHRLDRLRLRRDRPGHRDPAEQHARRVRPAATAGSPRPGIRFTSGMAPTIVLRDRRPRLVVGSAGSLRLRGAIFQIIVNVVGHGLGVEEAIDLPRVHLEESHVHCEGGHDPAELDRLESWGYELVRWRRRNLFFGGVSGVEFREDGTLAAAGDPRRGGHGVVIE